MATVAHELSMIRRVATLIRAVAFADRLVAAALLAAWGDDRRPVTDLDCMVGRSERHHGDRGEHRVAMDPGAAVILSVERGLA